MSAMRRGRRGTRQGATASKVSKWLAPVWEQLLILKSADRAHTAALAPAVECTRGAPRRIVHCNCAARGEHRNYWLRCLTLLLRQAWNASQRHLFPCHRGRGCVTASRIYLMIPQCARMHASRRPIVRRQDAPVVERSCGETRSPAPCPPLALFFFFLTSFSLPPPPPSLRLIRSLWFDHIFPEVGSFDFVFSDESSNPE